jgi:gliding motility-associated-like protein
MSKLVSFVAAVLILFFQLPVIGANAQSFVPDPDVSDVWQPAQPARVARPAAQPNGLHAFTNSKANYYSFSSPTRHMSDEAVAANTGNEHDPELGMLYREAPCSNCYEVISERTETTKTFVKEGSGATEKMTQTSTQPMHYRDGAGNWRTIVAQLQPDASNHGVYRVTQGQTPLTVSAVAGNTFAELGAVKFNNMLELIYVKPSGEHVSLGVANWTNHTAGDQGIYITDAWPGIDVEMTVLRSALKTNFHIKNPMPLYADGKLLIRDNTVLATGLELDHHAGKTVNGDILVKNAAGDNQYGIGAAYVYEQGSNATHVQTLDYRIGTSGKLDIVLPGDYLNKPAATYPVIIDPLVSLATSVPVTGSSYNATWATGSGCLYTNPANTPVNCTVTGIEFQFQYTAVSPMAVQYGAYSFYKGTCRSPAAAAFSWSCAGFTPGTCSATGGATYDIFSELASCLPPPSCASIPLNIQMRFYQNWATTAACVSTWCYGSQPFIITVFGRTVQLNAVAATPASICLGASSSLTASGIYGVGPYTYSWTPGALTGSPVSVSPTATTTYNLTITDACGITATGSTTVTINTVAPITGTTTLCVGNTSNLNDATTGGHGWTSSNTGVATITSPAGIVTAVAPGTTTITYTLTSTGCYTTTVVTVTPVPGAITGTATLCVGSATNLFNAATGGTWSSSTPGIASISSTGVVTGAAVGTATITYGSPSCYSTTTVTVNLLAPITGTLSVCKGNTTLLADAMSAGTWSSSNTAVATIAPSTGIVTGMSAGTTLISYLIPSGCYATAVVTVVAVPAIGGTPSVCVGSTTALSNVTTGGTWSSSNSSVATIDIATGVATGVNAATSMITYTESSLGCYATVVLSVNPLPVAIVGTPAVCAGLTTLLSDATAAGTWISDNTAVASVDAGGLLTGVSAGTANVTYQLPTGCIATLPVVVNPLPAAIVGAGAVCIGATIDLTDPDAGGTWTSRDLNMATVDAAGNVSALAIGNTLITYTLPTGCLITAPIAVAPLPVASFYAQHDICPGETTTLALTSHSSDIASYSWDFGAANIITASSNSGGPYVITWPSTGVYTLSMVATSIAGCSSQPLIDTVTVHTLPDAGILPINFIHAKSPAHCLGDSIGMAAKTNLYKHRYEWGPASFFETNVDNRVIGTIGHAGYITLTVIDPYGCKASDSVYVDAQSCCNVFFPTAFTPNGDGRNDAFRNAGLGYHKMQEFRVTNRWGQTVFESANPESAWDGTFNGEPQDMGVYYFFFTYDCDGKIVMDKGEVTLIR